MGSVIKKRRKKMRKHKKKKLLKRARENLRLDRELRHCRALAALCLRPGVDCADAPPFEPSLSSCRQLCLAEPRFFYALLLTGRKRCC